MWGQEPQQGLELRGCWPGASLVPGTLVEVWVQRRVRFGSGPKDGII